VSSENQTSQQGQVNEISADDSVNIVENMEFTLEASFGDRLGAYSGEVIDGVPNGQGSFTAENSEGLLWTYTGEFVDGHFNGSGKTEWEDGAIQEGLFYMDLFSEGTWHKSDGTLFYEGVLENGQPPALTDEEIEIMLVNPNNYSGRRIENLAAKLLFFKKNESQSGYMVVAGAGYLDLFMVSFMNEKELYVSIDDYVFITGTVAGEVVAEDGSTSVLMESAVAVDPATILLDSEGSITLTEFNRLKNGMSYRDVAYIIGTEGELLSESGTTSIYKWDGEGSIGANANVTFQDNKLVGKAQAGLE